jgi:hypothetical protein
MNDGRWMMEDGRWKLEQNIAVSAVKFFPTIIAVPNQPTLIANRPSLIIHC